MANGEHKMVDEKLERVYTGTCRDQSCKRAFFCPNATQLNSLAQKRPVLLSGNRQLSARLWSRQPSEVKPGVFSFPAESAGVFISMSDRHLAKRQSLTEHIPDTPGIYLIECLASGQAYVGAAVNMRRRVKDHLAFTVIFKDYPMHQDYLAYGLDTFQVRVLEEVAELSNLHEKEREWYGIVQPTYNTEPPKRNRFWNKG